MASNPLPDAPVGRLSGRGDGGYTLVILIILVTLLNILMAAALPVWSSVAQLDKEEELIFRGLQYSEAIRVFRIRYNRYPVKLEELIEVEPRCIRQLWKDPMTEDGRWGLVFASAGRGGVAPGATPPGQQQPPGENNEEQEEKEKAGQELAPPGQHSVNAGNPTGPNGRVTVGPIQGVFSRSSESGTKVFLGHTQYNQWRFTEQLVLASVGVKRGGNNNQIPNLSVRWVGRPLPSFIPQSQIAQGPGGPAGGQPQDLSPSGGVVGTPPQQPRGSGQGGGGEMRPQPQ